MLLLTVALLLLPLVGVAAAPSDFTLKAAGGGSDFRLSEARGKYVALHFLLKTECPFCLRYTREHGMSASKTPDLLHVFIKPDSEEEIRSWAGKLNEGGGSSMIAIHRDPEAALAESFGIPGGYAFHGQTVHYPALVLLNPQGKEVFRYVGKDNGDRFGSAQLVAKLAEVKSAPVPIKEYNVGADKLAISGYDPVSYFTSPKPAKGRADLRFEYRGVVYQFASEDNRTKFQAAPETYVPTYGGWCATAMAKGEKVEIDPTNFKITDGRLFLFFKAFYANAIKDWNKDEVKLTVKADANWKKIAGE